MTLISSSFSAVFSFFLIARKSPPRPHINPHPFPTLLFLRSRPRRRLSAWLGDNRVIPLESLALSRQFHYNTRLGSLFADLSKHKRYEIRLSVYNAVGEGPISTPQEVFVGEAGMCLLSPITRSASQSD